MDASGAGSSSNTAPTRLRVTMDVEELPSPTPPLAHLARILASWTVEDIYEDFSGRRSALVQALTIEQDELYDLLCEPGKEPMCLYGYADGSWELTLPEDMVPPGMPEPTVGINYGPNYINRYDYLSFVAHCSESWLMGVAFFLASHLDANERLRLFDMVNEMPSVCEEFHISYGTPWLLAYAPPSPDLTQNVYNPNRYSSPPAEQNVLVSPDLVEDVSNPNIHSITPAQENVPPSQDSMQNLSDPNKDSRKPAEDKGSAGSSRARAHPQAIDDRYGDPTRASRGGTSRPSAHVSDDGPCRLMTGAEYLALFKKAPLPVKGHPTRGSGCTACSFDGADG